MVKLVALYSAVERWISLRNIGKVVSVYLVYSTVEQWYYIMLEKSGINSGRVILYGAVEQ